MEMLGLAVWAGSLTFASVKYVWPMIQIYRMDQECDRLDAIIRHQETEIQCRRAQFANYRLLMKICKYNNYRK